MNNQSIKDLIMANSVQTSALITLWGLANYMNQSYELDETIIYQSRLLNLRITGRIFYGMAFMSSVVVMGFDLIKLAQYRL